MNKNQKNNRPDPGGRDILSNRIERDSSRPNDLPDPKKDQEKLRAEETFIDLPDVKDIPGQEFVNVPSLDAIGDTTIASDDEEGVSVFDRDDSEDLRTGNEADVSSNERRTLENADYMPTKDEDKLYQASMDDSDFQGEALNERSFGEERSGRDLDIPGSELDDRNENIGEEDEENNDYSLGSADNDNIAERTS